MTVVIVVVVVKPETGSGGWECVSVDLLLLLLFQATEGSLQALKSFPHI